MSDLARRRGSPSHLESLLRLGLSNLGTRRDSSDAGIRAPRRRPAVEAEGITIDENRLRRFLQVTDGLTLDWSGPDGSLLVTPGYTAVWETALMLDLLRDVAAGLPLRGLIHVESESVRIRPMRASDSIRCRLELDGSEPHARGMLLRLVSRNWNAAGLLCQENSMALLVESASVAAERSRGSRSLANGRQDEEKTGWTPVARWDLSGSKGRSYARVSRDFNPIHLWRWSAKLFGYERPILHGYCIQAMVSHALIRRRMSGAPSSLRRLRIAFRAPALLPTRLTVESRAGEFRVVSEAATRRRVVADGEFAGEGVPGRAGESDRPAAG